MRYQSTMLALAGGIIVLTQGCASMINQNRPVSITSEPAGADITVYDKAGRAVYKGVTPTTVTLKRDTGYFSAPTYTVEFEHAACHTCRGEIPHDVSGWYIGGNLIFGGLIGYLLVDPLTGAMWTLKDLHMNLESTSSANIEPTPPAQTEAAWRILNPPGLRPQRRGGVGGRY